MGMRWARALIFAVATVLATSCTTAAGASSSPAPESAVCGAKRDLDVAIAQLKTLRREDAGVKQIQDAVGKARAAWLTLRTRANEVSADELQPFIDSLRQLVRAAGQLPEGTTADAAKNSLRDELEAVEANYQRLSAELGCLSG